MGAWSTSVTGNDTAADLKDEYTCAFYRYPQEEALQKIEAYVRGMFDESDPEEWCAYVYSLSDFMWKKGILTDAVRARALQMIDSGFGLELWAESGEKVLRDRKKALEKFRTQITSPMGAVKKIKPNVHTEDIFTAGDLIAIKLMTAGKTYGTKHAASDRRMTEEAFQSYDGKYILLQKHGAMFRGIPRLSRRSAITGRYSGCLMPYSMRRPRISRRRTFRRRGSARPDCRISCAKAACSISKDGSISCSAIFRSRNRRFRRRSGMNPTAELNPSISVSAINGGIPMRSCLLPCSDPDSHILYQRRLSKPWNPHFSRSRRINT